MIAHLLKKMRTLKKLSAIALLLGTIFFIGMKWINSKVIQSVEDLPGVHRPVLSYFHRSKRALPDSPYSDRSSPLYHIKIDCVRDLSKRRTSLLTVEPNIVKSGEEVTVKWRGVSSPKSRDWIGLFCPASSTTEQYQDYWFVHESGTYAQGYGEVAFNVYNMRVDCEFRYYSNDTKCATLLGRSNVLKFVGGANQPTQGHIALTGNPSEMRVQWTSGTQATPTVRYGTSADQLNQIATGLSRTYKASDMCARPASDPRNFVDPGFLHDVLLTNLIPNTTIYYQYGSEGVMSQVHKFVSAANANTNEGFSFITYGDMGLSSIPGAKDTVKLVLMELDKGAELVLHQGDLSYAVGYAHVWEQWMDLIEPIATRVPYMVGIGNHEQDYLNNPATRSSANEGGNDGFHPSWGNYGHDSGGECGVPVRYRFHMPDNGNSVYWYSFEYGPVHFTFISTEHNFTTGSVQYKWIEKDLESTDRHKTPWLIVVGHRPMYTSEKYPSDYEVSLHLQSDGLEYLFHKYQVDLALWGHYHSYERTCRVYKQRCGETGTVNIVIGAAGAVLDSVGQYPVNWSKHLEMNYGYGRVTVANGSALLWEYIRNVDSVVADSVWLIK